ncbi:hypothetical protein ONS95_011430 [Cadophora gregata]|uniref:uncharacterized protein n=1 Tax=Cadophora gregata TaxID=51156 RepID=UPI0026DDA33B|nr:uncharacterized protein ONS95_011430 [Cadophora gregata]KAK0120012.1 hypothetical protein ONS95_011430 [Cadophora gregata]KAK0121046.1 hypothetical protein ONS96_011233 [Cadophora gregata f. sp. sojae]
MPIINPAFLIHALLELPASLNFFFRPNEQLSTPVPQAHALIRQYAVLLMSSNIVALIFAFRPVDETSRRVAGALATYHAAPLVRAVGRITSHDEGYGKALGGRWVHAVVHAGALGTLGWLFFGW